MSDRCPSCEADISAMDQIAFRDHMKAEHPELFDIISKAFATFEPLGVPDPTSEEQP